ncbi:Transposase [Mycobacterium tuberculosis]|nr:Transposase [Mycobacterium tuberculosis]
MQVAFGGVQASSTLGKFLRSFTHGMSRSCRRCIADCWSSPAQRAPLLPGADQVAFLGWGALDPGRAV